GVASLYGRPGLAGRANGDIRLDIDADDVDGFVNARIIELGRADDSAHANAMLQTRFEDRRASGELVVTGTNELDLNVFADLPIDVDASSLAVGVRRNAGMTFNASGGGPLGPIWAAAGPVNTRFEGRFAVDANYEGRTQAFRPDGSVSLKSGLFEDGDSGLFLKDVSLDARLRQDAIELLALDARGADGGRIEGAGRYAFDGAADIDLKLHRLDALRRSDIRAVLSGGLSFGAQAQGAALTGALKINEAHINVENLPRTKFKTLNVRFDEAPIEEAPAVSQDQSVALDIAMKADRRIYIQGGGFETEWDADMHVGGVLGAPLLDGEARILRGDLDFVGRRFEFVDSEIVFAGSPDKTQLALKAVYETDALTAAVEVTGVPEDPAIALTSDPDLPQDEVLSHILFGESAAGFGGVQSAQLAAGLAAISGGEAGFDLTGSLRDALGVDRLDLGTSSDGTASLRAGQYVAPDVYVELMSNARGAPGWGVTWTPQRRIEVGAEREAEDAPKFSVKWRRDYDFDNPLDGVRATGE
ncbi:MAG: translocation/assembly module TamB domain-containing protein, partial [Pseudomonadota bacterium]